jgi:hypothetical protein
MKSKPVFRQEPSAGKYVDRGFATVIREMSGGINVAGSCNVATNVAR